MLQKLSRAFILTDFLISYVFRQTQQTAVVQQSEIFISLGLLLPSALSGLSRWLRDLDVLVDAFVSLLMRFIIPNNDRPPVMPVDPLEDIDAVVHRDRGHGGEPRQRAVTVRVLRALCDDTVSRDTMDVLAPEKMEPSWKLSGTHLIHPDHTTPGTGVATG